MTQKPHAHCERGMVLLIVLFLAATMLIASAATALRLVTQGRRQREAEMVWRGEQYVRAIRLYYRRFGQFPKSFEDFSKNPGNLHFLRKEYKDPMNDTDGKWRYIYIGPTGQLMGSLTRVLPIGMVALGPAAGVPGAAAAGLGANPLGTSHSGSGGPGAGGGAAGASGFAPAGATSPAQPAGGVSSLPAPDTSIPQTLPIDNSTGLPEDFGSASGLGPGAVQPPKKAIAGAQTIDTPVFGGQLVGIGSKVDRKSLLFYKGYGKYREWEFIWDPAQDFPAGGGLPTGGILPPSIGGPQPTGAPGVGTSPGNPPPQPPQ